MKKIVITILPSISLGIYHLISRIFFRDTSNLTFINLLTSLEYLILPLIVILIVVLIKRNFFGVSNKLAFYCSLLPGFFMSFDFSYGAFATGHGYGFANYLNFLKEGGYWIFIVLSFISGLLGLLINIAWNKIKKSVNN